MRYVFKNIKILFLNNKLFFSLLILCELTAAFIVLFSYGAFYNYKMLKEIGTFDLNSDLNVSFIGEPKMDDIRKALDLINKDTLSNCQSISLHAYSNDNSLNEEISFFFIMDYRDGLKFFSQRIENMKVSEGQFITDEDYLEGKSKIMIPDKYSNLKIGDFIKVSGKDYEIICKLHHENYFFIPISCAPNDLADINEVSFTPEGIMKLSDYNNITKAFKTVFNNNVRIPEIDTFKDGASYYNSIGIIIAIITILSSITLMIVYMFILEIRKREFAIFRICGCSKKHIIFIYTMEIFITSLISFLIISAIYFNGIIDKLTSYMEYINQAYNFKSVIWISLIYLITIILVTMITVIIKIFKSPITQLKRR